MKCKQEPTGVGDDTPLNSGSESDIRTSDRNGPYGSDKRLTEDT